MTDWKNTELERKILGMKDYELTRITSEETDLILNDSEIWKNLRVDLSWLKDDATIRDLALGAMILNERLVRKLFGLEDES